MKRVEGDPHREHDIEKRQRRSRAQPGRDLVDVPHREVRVLEKSQESQIGRHRYRQTQPSANGILPPEQAEPGQVAHDRGKQHQRAKLVVPEGIERVATERQPDVSGALSSEVPKHEIRDGQKDVEKREAVEEHYSPPPGRGRPFPISMPGEVRSSTG